MCWHIAAKINRKNRSAELTTKPAFAASGACLEQAKVKLFALGRRLDYATTSVEALAEATLEMLGADTSHGDN